MLKNIIVAAAIGMLTAVCPVNGECASAVAANQILSEPVVVIKSDGVETSDIVVKQGDMIQLRLPENPSTGYSWNFQVFDLDYLEIIGDGFFYPQDGQNMLGRPGLRVFTLRAVDGGSTMVKLSYWRPWEGIKSRIDKFVINIEIKADEEVKEEVKE